MKEGVTSTNSSQMYLFIWLGDVTRCSFDVKMWWLRFLFTIPYRFLDVDCGSNSSTNGNNSSGEQGPEEDMAEPNNNSLFQENLEHRTMTGTSSISIQDIWHMLCLGKSAHCCSLLTISGILSTFFVRIQISEIRNVSYQYDAKICQNRKLTQSNYFLNIYICLPPQHWIPWGAALKLGVHRGPCSGLSAWGNWK